MTRDAAIMGRIPPIACAPCFAAALPACSASPTSDRESPWGPSNVIGFNKYSDDHPHHPYFTGWLGYQIRELFVRYLGSSHRRDIHMPSFFIWLGKRRYAAAGRRLLSPPDPASTREHSSGIIS